MSPAPFFLTTDGEGREIEVRMLGPGADNYEPGDECFAGTTIGNINIGKIKRDYAARPERFPPIQRSQIVDELVEFLIAKNDPDFAYIERMTPEDVGPKRFAIGLVVARSASGAPEVHVVDGTHYVLKRYFMTLPEFDILVVPRPMIREFRFTYERRRVGSTGPWRVIPMADVLERGRGLYYNADGSVRNARGETVSPPGSVRTKGSKHV